MLACLSICIMYTRYKKRAESAEERRCRWLWATVSVPLSEKRHAMTTATLSYEETFNGVWLVVQRIVHCYHAGKLYSLLVDTALEDSSGVPHLDQQAPAGRHWAWLELLRPQSPPQRHTSSIRATPIPTRSHLLILPLPVSLWEPFHLNHTASTGDGDWTWALC